MSQRIILISGHVAAGKSTLCKGLETRFVSSRTIHTRELILSMKPETRQERSALQAAGAELDFSTGGRWVADALQQMLHSSDPTEIVLIDSVRIIAQIEAIRGSFGPRVVHVHLDAPREVLRGRYLVRAPSSTQELKSYDQVLSDPTEGAVNKLKEYADIVIDTARCSPADVVVRAAGHLGLTARLCPPLVDVLVGGQYGSEGKGQVAAYLASEYGLLVRVGGPNAGHTVYSDPTPITFHLLPSGTLHSDAQLALGPGCVLSVKVLMKEIAEFQIDKDRLTIDPNAMIISDEDIKQETGIVASIGSTGQGVGVATARRINGRGSALTRACDVADLKPFLAPIREVLEHAYSDRKKILLEGTQGTGLSLFHGDYPHVTSRDTTVSGCLSEAGIAPSRVRRTVMVCRTYPIRVQSPTNSTSGPMAQEITWQEVSNRSGIPLNDLVDAERTSTTKRQRRVGEFDWSLLQIATSLNQPTDIALTFADYHAVKNRDARRFEQLSEETIRFVEEVERISGAPVSLISTRFHSRSIIDRRYW